LDEIIELHLTALVKPSLSQTTRSCYRKEILHDLSIRVKLRPAKMGMALFSLSEMEEQKK
jgi:hypothetical protein